MYGHGVPYSKLNKCMFAFQQGRSFQCSWPLPGLHELRLIKKNKPDFIIAHLITSLPLFLNNILNDNFKCILRISGYPKLHFIRKCNTYQSKWSRTCHKPKSFTIFSNFHFIKKYSPPLGGE